MSVNPIPVYGSAFNGIARKGRMLVSNVGNKLLQNPDCLKTNSLIFASLVLVLSRILVANLSAFKAKNTSESHYRHREAIRTTMREIGGWTLGFVVLRAIQTLVENRIKSTFGITEGKKPSFFRQWTDVIRKSWRGESIKADIFEMSRNDRFDYSTQRFAKWEPWLKKIPGLRNLQPREMLTALRRWVPLMVGSVPAILLSGYALERFTRDYNDKVIDALSNTKTNHQTCNPAAPATQNQARFNRFVQHVEQKKNERTFSGL